MATHTEPWPMYGLEQWYKGTLCIILHTIHYSTVPVLCMPHEHVPVLCMPHEHVCQLHPVTDLLNVKQESIHDITI